MTVASVELEESNYSIALTAAVHLYVSLRPSAHTEIRIKPDTKIFLLAVSDGSQRGRTRRMDWHCLEHARSKRKQK